MMINVQTVKKSNVMKKRNHERIYGILGQSLSMSLDLPQIYVFEVKTASTHTLQKPALEASGVQQWIHLTAEGPDFGSATAARHRAFFAAAGADRLAPGRGLQ